LSEVQLRHAGHVVDSVHRDHLLSIDGKKGTQSLYLRQLDVGEGESIFIIPFVEKLMTFDHRKPDTLVYERSLPLVYLSMDTNWDPHALYDDHGKLVIDSLEPEMHATVAATPNLSKWNHSETCSVLAATGDHEDVFHDALQGTRKEFYGKAFHLDAPPQVRRRYDTSQVHFVRQYDVDQLLGMLSYHELLGFLPEDPSSDSYVWAVREANAFRTLCEDPAVFLEDDEQWCESQSEMIGGVTTATIDNSKISRSDWVSIPSDLPFLVNSGLTADHISRCWVM
jgi:hypothetical protein